MKPEPLPMSPARKVLFWASLPFALFFMLGGILRGRWISTDIRVCRRVTLHGFALRDSWCYPRIRCRLVGEAFHALIYELHHAA